VPEVLVNQVYCSALSCGYSGLSNELWEPLARIILEASYEATLLAAMRAALATPVEQRASPHRVYLTFLGGGVFRNEPEWIACAIGRAIAVVSSSYSFVDLHVVICHFRRVNHDMQELIDEAFRQEMGNAS